MGVWRAVAEPDAVNLVLVVGSERALLVDTGSSPEQGRAVRAAVAAVTGSRWSVVVTHGHYDHAFGLAAFADLTTVAHESVPPGWPRPRRPRTPTGWDSDRRAGRADREWCWRPRSTCGGRRVEVAHLGRGHTDGDLVVVVPDADLVVRRRPGRVGRAAVARPGLVPARVAGHPRRRDRADDGRDPRGARARRPGRPGVRVRAARSDRGGVGGDRQAGGPPRGSRRGRRSRRLGPSVRRDPARVRGGGCPVPPLRRSSPARPAARLNPLRRLLESAIRGDLTRRYSVLLSTSSQ